MAVLLTAFPAHAASPEAEADATHGGIELFSNILMNPGKTGLAWILINFLVLMFILEKILFSKLRLRNQERHDSIKKALEEATEARARAEALLKESQERLFGLEEELKKLREAGRAQAEADRARVEREAELEAAKIRESAKLAAERDAMLHQREIENEVIDRAIAAAEQLLRKQYQDADEDRLVNDYIRQVSQTSMAGVGGRTAGASQ
jgi:F-type H+-transporting ATPase subunit b